MKSAIRIVLTAAFLFSSVFASHAAEPQYPSRPIRIIVPFAPGAATDIIARLLGQKMTEAWGQPVVVDNRGGANGFIAAEAVAKSAPDGYTVLVTTQTTHAANVSLFKKLPYDPVKDFTPVSPVSRGALGEELSG